MHPARKSPTHVFKYQPCELNAIHAKMSEIIIHLKQIENLNVNELAESLEFNGYAECVGAIRSKNIDGQEFLKLTELQISLWRLPTTQARRLWSFIQQVREDPTQFLMNFEKSTKVAPNVNMLKKPPLNKSPTSGSLSSKTNLRPHKPSVSVKPDISHEFQKSIQISETRSLKSEANFSTLTKQESNILKNQLEQLFKGEPTNSSFIYNQKQPQLPPKPGHLKVIVPKANNEEEFEEPPDDCNDGYLSPINVDPNRRKSDSGTNENEISATVTRSNSVSNNSFLNKLRKNYEHLEIRPEVHENKYEEQNIKPHKPVAQHRPLPPIPVEKTVGDLEHDIEFETDDEDLAEYTPVIDNEKPSNAWEHKGATNVPKPPKQRENFIKKTSSFNRPLPNIPPTQIESANQSVGTTQNQYQPATSFENEDDEDLAEYTPILDEDDEHSERKKKELNKPKGALFHRVLPATPTLSVSTIKQRPPIPTPSDSGQDVSAELTKSQTRWHSGIPRSPVTEILSASLPKLKPRIDLPNFGTLPRSTDNLPKPPPYLPKPPIDLLDPQDFSLKSQDLPTFDFNEPTNTSRRPLPPSPKPEPIDEAAAMIQEENIFEDEMPCYTEIDLAREPSYRETDRKGARRLLNGLTDGAFVIRPSRQTQYICTFSIITTMKMFNLGIERHSNGTLAFGSVAPDFEQPKFYSVSDIISYYTIHPLYLSGESIVLKDVLPRNRR